MKTGRRVRRWSRCSPPIRRCCRSIEVKALSLSPATISLFDSTLSMVGGVRLHYWIGGNPPGREEEINRYLPKL